MCADIRGPDLAFGVNSDTMWNVELPGTPAAYEFVWILGADL